MTLADSQQAAVRLALLAKVMVITGGPGVGKTTIVNAILRILATKGVRLLLCAPTGRVAKRMSEATAGRLAPSIGSWRSIPRPAVSAAVPIIRWTATSSWSTRARWWTSC